MKKLTMCFVGVMIVLSLAACTPTTEKQAKENPIVEVTTGGADDKVPDPNAKKEDVISVFYINEEGTELDKDMTSVETLDAQSMVDKLIEYGVLDADTKALSYDSKDKIGNLDLSKLPSYDKDKQTLTLQAIVNTFTENFELEGIKIKVNGKEYTAADIT